ncbi:hypothetical protein M2262_001650 [Pseudomonas sp. BIGb0408]|uniref:Uncharacterized protein n=1 Tax=Phytopseudomonas flavescens TaxID=29435 RepID=A0A7Y9XPE7_9GAMM|nr:hypothetical protein [Pseudomonas sp. BIGb0408]NYH73829.1 hypothetical protein [Pseudomonas flavescens]
MDGYLKHRPERSDFFFLICAANANTEHERSNKND